MPRIFDISTVQDPVAIEPGKVGKVSFTITNLTQQLQRGQLHIRPQGNANSSWFQLEGDVVRNFSPSAAGTPVTQQATVNVTIPPGTPPDKYTFQLVVADDSNPEEVYTDSPVVALDVPASVAPKPPFPWWILAVVAVLVAVGGVVAWLILRPKTVELENYVGKPIANTKQQLEARRLTVQETPQDTVICDPTGINGLPAIAVGTIASQNPQPGEEVEPEEVVQLSVVTEATQVQVPDVQTGNPPLTTAQQILEDCSLIGTQTETRATLNIDPGLVMEQTVPSGQAVGLNTEIGLIAAGESTTVPDVSGQSLQAAIQALSTAELRLSNVTGDPARITEPVVSTSPSANTVVLKDSGVVINMPGRGIIIPDFELRQIDPDILRELRRVNPQSP
ncbi:PASTA domain-containing protein [Leptolyngbya sp. AN02str]|uniref:PASTA domain-containing protein n=1 Tax=Leptolyngbya sp. AN02str TaxID=3423363 RepID=UPI003D310C68